MTKTSKIPMHATRFALALLTGLLSVPALAAGLRVTASTTALPAPSVVSGAFGFGVANEGTTTFDSVRLIADAGHAVVCADHTTQNLSFAAGGALAAGDRVACTMQPLGGAHYGAGVTVLARGANAAPQVRHVTFTLRPAATPSQGIVVLAAGAILQDTNLNGNLDAGETIDYNYSVLNLGTLALSALAVTDIDGAVICPQTTLAPAANMVCTSTHTITVTEAGVGQVLNQADITGTDASANPVVGGDFVVTRNLGGTAGISLFKSPFLLDDADNSGYASVNDILRYTFVVKNSNAQALSTVNVIEPNPNRIDTAIACAAQTLGGLPFTGLGTGVLQSNDVVLCTADYTIKPTDASGGSADNLAESRGQPTIGTLASGSGASAVVIPTLANVSVVKTLTGESGSLAGIAEPGETLTYTITLSNSGGADALNYGAIDRLDPNTIFVSADNGGSVAGGNIVWTGLTVPGGGSLTLTVTVNVVNPIPAGVTSIANVAYQAGTTPAVCPPAGPQCVITPTAGNVTIAKALTGESGTIAGVAEAGENLTYTITLTNTGGADVAAYGLSDAVPVNTTFVSATDGGAVTTGVINWTGLTVPKQIGATAGTKTVTVVVKVVSPIPAGVTSIANVAYQTGTTPPPCPNAACVVTPTSGAVTITKTLTGESGTIAGVAEAGENLTYTITLTNSGGADVTGYALSDAVPASTTFVSATDLGTVTAGVINWTGLTVPKQIGATAGTKIVTVVVKVVSPIPAGVTSIANVAYQTGTTPPLCPNAACVVTPTAGAVTLFKTLTGESGSVPGVAELGETLTYTITLTNTGGSAVTGYGVTDQVDVHASFVSADNAGAYAAGKVTWTNLSVPANGSLTLTVVVKVDLTLPAGVTQVANLVYSTGTPPPTCPPAGPQCVITPTVGAVTIAKALTGESGTQPGFAEPAETLTYTITLANSGGTAVTGFGVTDPLDTNVDFVSADNGGANAGGVITWSGLTVPANGSLTLTVVVTVKDPLPVGVTKIVNLAYATGTSPPDCALLPTLPACVVTPPAERPRLSVTKTANVAQALPSGTIQYTITVTNVGTVVANNVVISDPLPAGIASFAWQCTASGGVACPAASGNGALNEAVSIFPVGAQLSYSVLAVLTGRPVSPVLNVVSVTPSQNTVCAPALTAPPCLANVSIVIGVPPPAVTAIPTPINSEWMLLLMLLAIGGTAVVSARRFG